MTFLKLMNFIFANMLDRSVSVYLINILIFNKTKKDQVMNRKAVGNTLRNEKLLVIRGKRMILLEKLHI